MFKSTSYRQTEKFFSKDAPIGRDKIILKSKLTVNVPATRQPTSGLADQRLGEKEGLDRSEADSKCRSRVGSNHGRRNKASGLQSSLLVPDPDNKGHQTSWAGRVAVIVQEKMLYYSNRSCSVAQCQQDQEPPSLFFHQGQHHSCLSP